MKSRSMAGTALLHGFLGVILALVTMQLMNGLGEQLGITFGLAFADLQSLENTAWCCALPAVSILATLGSVGWQRAKAAKQRKAARIQEA